MDIEKNQNESSLYGGIKIDTGESSSNSPPINPDSCIEGLSEKGIWISYLICFCFGLMCILFSFDYKSKDFVIWFSFGNIALFSG